MVDTQNRLRTIQALGEEEHDKALTLERENLRLHDTETKLHKLQVRMPAIEHYLKLVPTLAKYVSSSYYVTMLLTYDRQNDQMRQQLMSLGITVPLSESLAYDKDPYPFDENDDVSMDYSDLPTRSPRQVISSHTAGRSPCTGYSEKEAMSHNLQSRPLKRQRVDSPLPEKNIHAPPPLSRDVASPLRSRDMMPPPTSRDMMPPPKKPLSRMKSMKKLFPTIRKKLSHGRYSSTSNGNRISEGGDVQMYDDKHCGRVERPSEHETSYNHSNERSPTRFKNRDESPYMTGALPVGHAPRLTDSPLPQLRSSVGHQSEQGDFKFRVPSPIKQLDSQQHGLPTERSYIRLMDGLSHDARLELGLQDPRSSAFRPDQRLQQHRQTKDTDGSPSRSLQTDGRNRWGSGHALLRQSPKGAAYDHPDPLRSNPTNYIMAPRNEPSMAPITPVPRRFQQPAPSGDSVVSPFFESDSRNARRYPRARDAERESSSIRSTNSQYQRSRATPIQVDWHEPRSLNGLSFFNSPRNMEYEPIEYRHESPLYSVPPQQQYPVYHSRYLNSRGFITRSDIQQSPYGNDSAYGSSLERPSYSRQARGPGQHTVPSIPFNRPSHSRAAPLPSAMPSTVSTKRSPIRTSRSQWNTLASTGVRSSRQMESTPSNSFMTPSRIIFDSSGRRSTRR